MSEVKRESGRRISFLTAAKSMDRAFVGLASRLMQSSAFSSHLLRICPAPAARADSSAPPPRLRSPRRARPGLGLRRQGHDQAVRLGLVRHPRRGHVVHQGLRQAALAGPPAAQPRQLDGRGRRGRQRHRAAPQEGVQPQGDRGAQGEERGLVVQGASSPYSNPSQRSSPS